MNLPIMILGAGPAGLAAAEAASADGQAVVLVDENPAPGGQIWRGGPGAWQDKRAQRLWSSLHARAHVRMLFGARLVGMAGPDALLFDTGAGPLTLAWQKVIVCSGARELLLPFPGWTLPGVTGAGGLQALVKGGMPVAGKRVVVAGSGPLLLAVADSVLRHGGQVAAIVEHRPTRELAGFGARLAMRHRGKLAQAVALFGCAVTDGRVRVDASQRTSVDGVWAAGELTGIGGVDKALAEGRIAGLAAVGKQGTHADLKARIVARGFARLLADSFGPTQAVRELCAPATIVCRCEDVRARELAQHDTWRAAKLQTRVGMGPCQGRVCGAACGFLYGWDSAGSRPPVFPVSVASLVSVE